MSLHWTGRWQDGIRYGGLGFPLAFVALPLYVVLPNHYADQYGVPLAWLGLVLLLARLLDAIADPWIGRWTDTLLARSSRAAWKVAALAAVVLALGFSQLFFPPAGIGIAALLAWCGAWLIVTYLGYSVIMVIHQAWGARLGGHEAQRAQVVAWREGLALAGVLVASALPSIFGLSVIVWTFAGALAGAMILFYRAPQSGAVGPAEGDSLGLMQALHTAPFRRLLLIYLLNGIATAIPATLVLFFIRDRLQAPTYEPLFLMSYFGMGAVSIPLWIALVRRVGLAWSWLVGMALAIGTFAWASALGAGDVSAFALVCLLSGVALGADLTLPGALLTGVIQDAGHAGRSEGSYVGWWNFATKLNLALAAGLTLPALQWFGYVPGQNDEVGLSALGVAYCVIPCTLKLMAAGLLGRWCLHPPGEHP